MYVCGKYYHWNVCGKYDPWNVWGKYDPWKIWEGLCQFTSNRWV